MTSQQGPSLFEQIKKSDDHGNEFWSARDLAKALEYTENEKRLFLRRELTRSNLPLIWMVKV